jgi:hypothetical protein
MVDIVFFQQFVLHLLPHQHAGSIVGQALLIGGLVGSRHCATQPDKKYSHQLHLCKDYNPIFRYSYSHHYDLQSFGPI